MKLFCIFLDNWWGREVKLKVFYAQADMVMMLMILTTGHTQTSEIMHVYEFIWIMFSYHCFHVVSALVVEY